MRIVNVTYLKSGSLSERPLADTYSDQGAVDTEALKTQIRSSVYKAGSIVRPTKYDASQISVVKDQPADYAKVRPQNANRKRPARDNQYKSKNEQGEKNLELSSEKFSSISKFQRETINQSNTLIT